MNKATEIVKYLILAGVVAILGWQFLTVYQTKVRNEAIDGCAAQSVYQAEYEENSRRITIREPQRHIYKQCLLDKGIVLDATE